VGNGIGNLLLDFKNFFQSAVKLTRPQVKSIRGLDQLRGDAQLLAGFTYAALED